MHHSAHKPIGDGYPFEFQGDQMKTISADNGECGINVEADYYEGMSLE
jgi:hypothetical protein